ncbi:hypothetical protein H632_c1164p0 [Helicosporidium sp. ATCC 50920]|nr:hypothetical protein H632_c1164p0 [Helicosporidium sp. ATCC 50920]|eukprot:KDD74640.1 hypothetical protein H632_c1164p0 [Helicosporidium sp. ATCC 50920]
MLCCSPVSVATPQVVHEGRNYQVTVQPGTEGKAKFEQTIREIFGLSDKDAISLTFGCALPTPPSSSPTPLGGDITLSGWESFDAAVFCASLSAGQRLSRKAAQAAQAASMGPGSGAGPSTPCSSPLRRGIMGDMLRRMFAG